MHLEARQPAFSQDPRSAYSACMDDTIKAAVAGAASLIREGRRFIAFTGAGVSAESGVPTFRGPGGLWATIDPGVLEISRFHRDPVTCWEAIRELFYSPSRPRPSSAHRILASWEKRGILSFLVTQNIDGLHREAGTRHISEFHGSIEYLVCMSCGERTDAGPAALASGLLEILPPRCATCGGVLKPDFVFFGEGIPTAAYQAAFEAASGAGLCMIIGSTGLVYPAAEIPWTVKRAGGRIIEIDPGETEFTRSIADIHIGLGAVEALGLLDAALGPSLNASARP